VGQPTGGEVKLAREDLSNDAKFWYGSSDVIRDALSATRQLGLSGFEFGKFAVDRGMLIAYGEIMQYVEDRLGEGVVATEELGQALDAALRDYDRSDRGSAHRIEKTQPGR
jgi:hypothetical protein